MSGFFGERKKFGNRERKKESGKRGMNIWSRMQSQKSHVKLEFHVEKIAFDSLPPIFQSSNQFSKRERERETRRREEEEREKSGREF